MNAGTPSAAHRFPLLGRPRPPCPSLPDRVHEIANLAGATSGDQPIKGEDALNRAALIASDCGVASLARDLCWRHINVYRVAGHPLTVLQARHMLEPVLNLARLQIRAGDGEHALRLLTSMYRAVTCSTDLVVDGCTLPLADPTGTRQERHKLREWVWLHLLGDGIRTLTLAGRWDDAVAYAQAHRGVGLHLMEGRQATIVAHCLNGASAAARAALAESTPTQPWEVQVASCLRVMCADAEGPSARRTVAAMVGDFVGQEPGPGYVVYRTQLGLTVATLASAIDSDASARIFAQVTDEAIRVGDGYAARDVLRYRGAQAAGLTTEQERALYDLVDSSGLGAGTLAEPLLSSLLSSAQAAAEALAASLQQSESGCPAVQA